MFVHPSIDWHTGYFQILAFVNNASNNIGIQISVRDPDFSSFGCIAMNKIAGLGTVIFKTTIQIYNKKMWFGAYLLAGSVDLR